MPGGAHCYYTRAFNIPFRYIHVITNVFDGFRRISGNHLNLLLEYSIRSLYSALRIDIGSVNNASSGFRSRIFHTHVLAARSCSARFFDFETME